MKRTTRADIEAELFMLERVVRKLGMKNRGDEWILVSGSVAGQEPWRLLTKRGRDLAPVTFVPAGVLGANRTETLNNIKVLRYALTQVLKKLEVQ